MNRRIMVGLVAVSLVGLVVFSVMGTSVAELERLATRELVPEIQLAAGIALGRHYAEVKTLAEMEALAVEGATPGLRLAAQIALEHLFVAAEKTMGELIAIAETGATVELRRAALPALNRFLVVVDPNEPTSEEVAEITGIPIEDLEELTVEELRDKLFAETAEITGIPIEDLIGVEPTAEETAAITGIPIEDLEELTVEELRAKFLRAKFFRVWAEEGVTAEIRLAAARGLVFPRNIRFFPDILKTMALEEPLEIAVAAGENLGGWFLFHPEAVKTAEEIVELTLTGETEGLRTAGFTALVIRLIEGEMTTRELMTKLLAITGTLSAEYRDAYMWALADRLAVP